MLRFIQRFAGTCNLDHLILAKNWSDIKAFNESNKQEIEKFAAGATYTTPGGITFSKITNEMENEAFDVLSKVVAESEPLALNLKISEAEFKHNICKNLLKMSNYQNLSLAAIYEGKIIGAFMSVDWKNQNRKLPESPEDLEF